MNIDLEYKLKNDIEFAMDTLKMDVSDLLSEMNISRTTFANISKNKNVRSDVYERFYSYLYKEKYRLNKVKEEIAKEKHACVLFHGSKFGLNEIKADGARNNCDFGNGFYLGENYNQALSFVFEKENSSIYSFSFDANDLRIKRFGCDLEWMLAICYYRGSIKQFSSNKLILSIIKEVESSDVIIAPIADNKMFYIMSQFAQGEINVDVAMHSLSASNLGLQYVLKTDKALSKLAPIEKYYISIPERNDCRAKQNERALEIDTKLKLAKREFKEGLFIEELLK